MTLRSSFKGTLHFFFCLCLALEAWAPTLGAAEDPLFPVDEAMRIRVNFWKKVYTEIPSTQSFVHDSEDLSVIYAIITHQNLSRRSKSRLVSQTKKEWRNRLQRLASLSESEMGEEDKKLYTQLGKPHKKKLLDYSRNIRTQQGLRDRYLVGLKRSHRYLKSIEAIFKQEGLPRELIYLPHVESSFNSEAYSKVGAAGMWQFMRATGRLYGLKVGYIIDERRDPIKATKAAARFLKDNYRQLKTWPLALTAYNHGPASLKRAVSQIGTRKISAIIDGYEGRRFGFASKNFYATFMATKEVSDEASTIFPNFLKDPPFEYSEMALPKSLTMDQIQSTLGLSSSTLQQYNLALRPVAFRSNISIPKGFRLRVPLQSEDFMMSKKRALAQLESQAEKLAAGGIHLVSRGENLHEISKLYRVALSDLIVLNEISSPSRIYPGMKIKIPTTGQKIKAPTQVVKKDIPKDETPSKPTLVAQQEKTIPEETKKSSPISLERLRNLFSPPQSRQLSQSAPDLLAPMAQTESPPTTSPSFDPQSQASIESYQLTTRELATNYYQITVETDETLGHLAEWAQTRASEIRRLNDLSFRQGIRVGQKLKILLSPSEVMEFKKQRIEYHLAIEEDFYSTFKLTGTKSYVIQRGDSPEEVSKRFEVPLWLLRKYQVKNPKLVLYVGQTLTIPIVEPNGEDETIEATLGQMD